MKKSGIYRIKNIITGDCYVGSANNIERRWKEHQRHLRNNKHCNPIMQRSYNKYGVDAFVYNVLDYCGNILEREQMFIDTGAFKFNICKVAGNTSGRKLSEEHKAKLYAANKGRKFSDETKAKMSAARKGRTPNKGKKTSDETKAKLSAASKGKKDSDKTKAKKKSAAIKAWHLRKGKMGEPEQLGPDEV